MKFTDNSQRDAETNVFINKENTKHFKPHGLEEGNSCQPDILSGYVCSYFHRIHISRLYIYPVLLIDLGALNASALHGLKYESLCFFNEKNYLLTAFLPCLFCVLFSYHGVEM